MLARKQPFALSIQIRRWFARPGWLVILGIMMAGICFALLGDWLFVHGSAQLHRLANLMLIGIVFPVCIALAISELIQVRREARAAQAKAVEDERLRISQELHDSIAQEIGYLHFKLDSLASDDTYGATAAIREELEQMRAVTGEAYDHIYAMLTDLRLAPSAALAETLLARARWVGSRAGFEATLATHGAARSLVPDSQQKVLYIFREALNNVEKHAAASHVTIDIAWQPEDLIICLRDDGRGFVSGNRPGHFGLDIMRERADQIGGQLAIESQPGAGTAVRLSAPLAPNCEPDRPNSGNGRGQTGDAA